MDKFLQSLTGGITAGTNKIEFFNSSNNNNSSAGPPPGGITWTFRRDHINQEKEKLGVSVNNEMRLIQNNNFNQSSNSTFASAHANVLFHNNASGWFVVAVNGRIVANEQEFWNQVLTSLDVRITLCDAGPVDELLSQITAGSNGQDEASFSPSSSSYTSSSNQQQANHDEPNYRRLADRDSVRYNFLINPAHPLHGLWQQLRVKTIKARDALKFLEEQLHRSETQKKNQQAEDALALLDSSSSSSDDEDEEESNNNNNNNNNNNGTANINHANRINNNPFATASASPRNSFSSPQQQKGSIFELLDDDANAVVDGKKHTTASSDSQQQQQLQQQSSQSVSCPDAIPLPHGATKPAPPSRPPPFIAYTYRAEQARRSHGSSK